MPVPGENLLLEFVKIVGLRRIMIEDLAPLTPGAPVNPFVVKLSTITVTYCREGTMFRFDAQPVQCGNEWAIARPKRISRFERRGHFRMLMESSTAFRMSSGPPEKRYPARIVNLSAGGALLVTRSALTPGDRISVIIPVGKDGTPTYIAADILETLNRPEPERKGFLARARFVTGGSQAVSPETRDGIMKFIFEQQRLMLRARKLTG
jgi:c-di-GMP-binding flagellar brake protein YcgR